MARAALTGYAIKRTKNIHTLSRRRNSSVSAAHQKFILGHIEKHIKEIKELLEKNDKHYLTETGDLVILCLELIVEGKGSPNALLLKCFKRFEDKLTAPVKNRSNPGCPSVRRLHR